MKDRVQVDAGAELVITQLFYDVEKFIQYEKDCRAVGIDCPIIPGRVFWKPTRLKEAILCIYMQLPHMACGSP